MRRCCISQSGVLWTLTTVAVLMGCVARAGRAGDAGPKALPPIWESSVTLKAGLKLMIGGMIESRIAMGCSFSLVLGMTGFDVLDLDTPLLLATDPIQGGYRYDGPMLQPWTTEGLGLAVETPSHGQITTEA